MKGLYRFLAPFAPDYSGAVSVFFGMNGMTVICDPGGCSGNVCGYDEPRFYGSRNLLFSAAIRDLDTIFGRDDLLEQKIRGAAAQTDAVFIALVGTPVVSVVATDLKAVGKILRRKTGLDTVAVDTNGMDLYDKGEEKAYSALFDTVWEKNTCEGEKAAAVFGALPLELPSGTSQDEIKTEIEKMAEIRGIEKIVFIGEPGSLDIVKSPERISCSVVIAPAGLKAARKLEKKFGIPYISFFPVIRRFRHIGDIFCRYIEQNRGKNIKTLIIHQQIAANSLRRYLLELSAKRTGKMEIYAGTWFIFDESSSSPGDVFISDEDMFVSLISEGNFDIVIADPFFRKAISDWQGLFIDFTHFAVSGDLYL